MKRYVYKNKDTKDPIETFSKLLGSIVIVLFIILVIINLFR